VPGDGYGPDVTEPRSTAVEVDDRTSELILAAGGMVIRQSGPDRIEIAIVHRPIREDWSYPKGKVEPKETLTECALREVLEETGLRCRIVSFVGTTEYRDRKDRRKIAAYWVMTPEEGRFRSKRRGRRDALGRVGGSSTAPHLRARPRVAGDPAGAGGLDLSPTAPLRLTRPAAKIRLT
jgi:ADP-ribose pyrophosphatase YjhB (NUDIX family)